MITFSARLTFGRILQHDSDTQELAKADTSEMP